MVVVLKLTVDNDSCSDIGSASALFLHKLGKYLVLDDNLNRSFSMVVDDVHLVTMMNVLPGSGVFGPNLVVK
jgi:hypothetical protein